VRVNVNQFEIHFTFKQIKIFEQNQLWNVNLQNRIKRISFRFWAIYAKFAIDLQFETANICDNSHFPLPVTKLVIINRINFRWPNQLKVRTVRNLNQFEINTFSIDLRFESGWICFCFWFCFESNYNRSIIDHWFILIIIDLWGSDWFCRFNVREYLECKREREKEQGVVVKQLNLFLLDYFNSFFVVFFCTSSVTSKRFLILFAPRLQHFD
jgi:hypothetical protein